MASEYRRYKLEQKSEKSMLVGILLGLFLSPLAYVYAGNWKLAVINILTLNYLLTGFVVVPIHVAMSIRKSRKTLSGMD